MKEERTDWNHKINRSQR